MRSVEGISAVHGGEEVNVLSQSAFSLVRLPIAASRLRVELTVLKLSSAFGMVTLLRAAN
jgi:hypothetical protein